MDNYITSFSLSQGENTYMGRLEGENIIMLFNEGVSLQGARATVELSENATITPNPLEIDNWLEEYQFVVISYNGSRRVYRYIPRFSNIFSDGDLTLETQADVDAFPKPGDNRHRRYPDHRTFHGRRFHLVHSPSLSLEKSRL
ncbi:MAG: hypothetical protein AB2L24_23100 [Mangrovibacterium sp.]